KSSTPRATRELDGRARAWYLGESLVGRATQPAFHPTATVRQEMSQHVPIEGLGSPRSASGTRRRLTTLVIALVAAFCIPSAAVAQERGDEKVDVDALFAKAHEDF